MKRMEALQRLSEDELRKRVVMPLLEAMGYKDVLEYHGPAEKGKDIICWKPDDFKGRVYFAVIVKVGPIQGAIDRPSGAASVLHQVQQAFFEPYRDVYGLSEVRMNRCLVVTSGSISSTAIESISGTLRHLNLDRCVDFVDGKRLNTLTGQYLTKTCALVGHVVITYEPGVEAYYFYLNPKRHTGKGPAVESETLQFDRYLVTVDFNHDRTVHGVEFIDFGDSTRPTPEEITPEELLQDEQFSEPLAGQAQLFYVLEADDGDRKAHRRAGRKR